MTRILTTIHLSDVQKEVLAKVKASPNPQIAWETISRTKHDIDDNFTAAKNILGNLGLLYVGGDVLDVTEKGLQVMQDENIIDETGELTDEGRELAEIDRTERPKQKPQEEPPPDETGGLGGMGGEGEFPTESLSMIKDLAEREETLKILERLSNNLSI